MTKLIDERAQSLIIAGKILDENSRDPDSDESILARQLIRATDTITDLQAQLYASREKMDCGHPKSCWVDKQDTLPYAKTILKYCSICAEIQAERAAVLT